MNITQITGPTAEISVPVPGVSPQAAKEIRSRSVIGPLIGTAIASIVADPAAFRVIMGGALRQLADRKKRRGPAAAPLLP